MKRDEAQKLIGTKVEAWTSANGVYVGTLIAVIPRRPWRGTVKIEGILEAAQPWEVGGASRKGKRPGDLIEVGGVNIKPTTATGVTYLESLEAQRAKYARFDANEFWVRESLSAIDRLIAAEKLTQPKA